MITKKEGHWIFAHSGPGFSNTNCSSEVHWRTLKEGVLGSAGKAGGGYSQLQMQSNLALFIENDSKQSLVDTVEKGQSVSFAKSECITRVLLTNCRNFQELSWWYASPWIQRIWV